jgi:2-haloacid dehalogenase
MSDRDIPEGNPDRRHIVVFDLGGVLIDWNPRHLYRKLFDGDNAAMERFLESVCSPAWNRTLDSGASFAESVAELVRKFPEQAHLIEAYSERFEEMFSGPIDGVVEVLADLKSRGVPLYALTNWSADKAPVMYRLFDFVNWFDGVVVSGLVGCAKPDREIYEHLLRTYLIDARTAVYIDDVQENVDAATALGFAGVWFQSPGELRQELVHHGLL